MSLSVQLEALVNRIGQEFQDINTTATGSANGSLSSLQTTNKTSLVAAINEVHAQFEALDAAALVIDDSSSSSSHTYSSAKVQELLVGLKNELLGDGVMDGVLDTIKEIATYAEANKDLITQLQSLSDKRVAVDKAQVFTDAEKLQGQKNLGLDAKFAELDTTHADIVGLINNVDGKVSAEAAARAQAITDVIESVEAEEAARKAADVIHTNAIAAESAARVAADDIHTAAIARVESEYKAQDVLVDAKIVKEINDRTSAINALSAEVDTKDGVLKGLIEDEVAAREAAILAISSSTTDSVNTEKLAREAADDALQAALDAEIAARVAANTVSRNLITAEETARKTADQKHSTDIANEVALRASEIARVEGLIATEETNCAARILVETNARKAADAVLDGKITALTTAVGDTEQNLVSIFEAALVRV